MQETGTTTAATGLPDGGPTRVTLVRVSGAALVVLLGAAAAGLRDVEAAAMTVGSVLCMALGRSARTRVRILGLIASASCPRTSQGGWLRER